MRNTLGAVVAGFLICGIVPSALAAPPVVQIDGSSTVYPVTEAVAEEFQKEKKGEVNVTVGVSGTGGGFKKFTRGEIDVADASRPISAKEMQAAKENSIEYIELPVAFDALTVVVNPQNDWAQQMTVEDLKKIWSPEAQGKVMKWSDVRPEWPDRPLKLYGPGTDSGTFDYFTEAIVGKSKASRSDFTASEDDNVLVQGVSSDPGALGYFGYAYYAENKDKLKAVPVVNPNTKQAVAPSDAAVESGQYHPLSRPIFIYVSKQAMQKPEVAEFVQFYLETAPDLVRDVKYVPLPGPAYEKAAARVEAGQTGTAYGGEPKVGMTIDELFSSDLVSEPRLAAEKSE